MNKALFLLILLLPFWCAAQDALVIKNVSVIDLMDSVLKPGMTLVMKGNRIASIGRNVEIPPKAKVIDASGQYLIPGLWDMHVHSLFPGRPAYFFPLFIANGITAIRDMGASLSLDTIQFLRKQLATGQLMGPRILQVCGKMLDGAGSRLFQGQGLVVETPDEGRSMVQLYKSQGADFIKVYDMLSRKVYLAIIEEAKRQKLPVMGHIPFSMTAKEVSSLGQRSIEHIVDVFISASVEENDLRQELERASKSAQDNLSARQSVEMKAVSSYDPMKAEELFATFQKNDTWHCPTLALRKTSIYSTDSLLVKDFRLQYMPVKERERWKNLFRQRAASPDVLAQRIKRFEKSKEVVREMHRAGVNILAGTDISNPYLFPGFSLHEELQVLVEAGLSPFEALQAATSKPAEFLHLARDFGTVEKGKMADLVLLDANPLQDIGNTKRIAAVIVNGKFLKRKNLDALLKQAKDFVEKP
jgi:hypothetical protein